MNVFCTPCSQSIWAPLLSLGQEMQIRFVVFLERWRIVGRHLFLQYSINKEWIAQYNNRHNLWRFSCTALLQGTAWWTKESENDFCSKLSCLNLVSVSVEAGSCSSSIGVEWSGVSPFTLFPFFLTVREAVQYSHAEQEQSISRCSSLLCIENSKYWEQHLFYWTTIFLKLTSIFISLTNKLWI
jgi:hypothetical protein